MNDNFCNSDSDRNINFSCDISPPDTKYSNPNKIREGFECLCKNGLSVLQVNIRSINKNFETCKHFHSTLNFTFNGIYFSETWATDNSICNVYKFSDRKLHRIKSSKRI